MEDIYEFQVLQYLNVSFFALLQYLTLQPLSLFTFCAEILASSRPTLGKYLDCDTTASFQILFN
jgi:hypothetical protein